MLGLSSAISPLLLFFLTFSTMAPWIPCCQIQETRSIPKKTHYKKQVVVSFSSSFTCYKNICIIICSSDTRILTTLRTSDCWSQIILLNPSNPTSPFIKINQKRAVSSYIHRCITLPIELHKVTIKDLTLGCHNKSWDVNILATLTLLIHWVIYPCILY